MKNQNNKVKDCMSSRKSFRCPKIFKNSKRAHGELKSFQQIGQCWLLLNLEYKSNLMSFSVQKTPLESNVFYLGFIYCQFQCLVKKLANFSEIFKLEARFKPNWYFIPKNMLIISEFVNAK